MAPHLGHVHLKVSDLERATEFYRDVLGLDVSERVGRFVFLTFGEHHHDLALQGVSGAGGDESTATEPRGGLYHSAWEVDDADALREAAEHLQAQDVTFSPVDHGISKALYFDDPDGNGVEVYLDTREQRNIEDWNGRNERFDPFAL